MRGLKSYYDQFVLAWYDLTVQALVWPIRMGFFTLEHRRLGRVWSYLIGFEIVLFLAKPALFARCYACQAIRGNVCGNRCNG